MVSITQKQPHRNICGAKAKSTGEPCKKPAGWGTDHPGEGRCRYHGGASNGAPKKNKNAVKTGEHETIWLDQLDHKEKELFYLIDVDVMKQLDEEIKLTTIRERRMLERIANLANLDYTVVEKKYKKGNTTEGPVNVKENKEKATLGQIQDIEDALTRVQSRKARLLSIKHKIIDGADPNQEREVANFLTRLKKSVKNGN